MNYVTIVAAIIVVLIAVTLLLAQVFSLSELAIHTLSAVALLIVGLSSFLRRAP